MKMYDPLAEKEFYIDDLDLLQIYQFLNLSSQLLQQLFDTNDDFPYEVCSEGNYFLLQAMSFIDDKIHSSEDLDASDCIDTPFL